MVEKLSPVGELDEVGLEAFEAELDQVPADAELVIDFSGVTFCGSVAMRSLVRTRNRLNESGGSLVVRNPQSIVSRGLLLAKLAFLIDD